jgi:two-component system NtrC family sensor kinase
MEQMKFTRLLAFRLFFIILTVMLVGTTIFTTISVHLQSDQLIRNRTQDAWRISDLIKRSTHYSMLLNRRDDIYQIINTLGSEPGIEAIRIYNKKGEITFSTVADEVGKNVDMTAEACIGCHIPGQKPLSSNPGQLDRIFVSSHGYRVLGMITAVHNEPSCVTVDCHAHPSTQTVLGVFDVMMPLKELDANLASMRRELWTNALLMFLAITFFTGIFIWLVVNIPVRKLTLGTQQIIKGNLDYHISAYTRDEIGQLAESFNTMTKKLKRVNEELKEWTHTLEERVKEKTEELRRAQVNMIQMEKMVSLGKLASTVAHELNNPLEGILTYAKLLQKRIAKLESNETITEMRDELALIADETARCGSVVKNLLLFSRQKVGEFVTIDIRTIIHQSLKLIGHHLQIHNINVVKDISQEELIFFCDPQQIEQALLAIEINAVEAMPEGGTLTIKVLPGQKPEDFQISICDTGPGIPEEIIPRIFEPFFTTKQTGNGIGLGLSVVYGIVERHGGTIDVQSKPHEGATFIITFSRTRREGEYRESSATSEGT